MQPVEQLELPADPSAPQRARAFVRAQLRAWDLEPLLDTVLLLTSELVTNAVLHTASASCLTVRRAGTGVLVTLEDGSPTGPALRLYGPGSTTGRGVALLDDLADEWGWQPGREGKAVWFRASTRRDPWDALDADAALASP